MMHLRRSIPCRSVAGFMLLAAMLFYVSGAALQFHIELEHSHDRHIVDVKNTDRHGEPCKDDPADAPPSPSKGRCQLCDMLTGSLRPMMVVDIGAPLFTTVKPVRPPIPAESPADRLFVSDISRRGPPSQS